MTHRAGSRRFAGSHWRRGTAHRRLDAGGVCRRTGQRSAHRCVARSARTRWLRRLGPLPGQRATAAGHRLDSSPRGLQRRGPPSEVFVRRLVRRSLLRQRERRHRSTLPTRPRQVPDRPGQHPDLGSVARPTGLRRQLPRHSVERIPLGAPARAFGAGEVAPQ